MTDTRTTFGDELVRTASHMDKSSFRSWLRNLSEQAKDQLELAYRRAFLEKLNRQDQTARIDAAFAGSRRTVVRDDGVPTLESINRRFGVTSPWDLTGADALDQAETDRILALPAGGALLEASRSWLGPDTTTEPAADLLARTDPLAYIAGLRGEASRADLAKLIDNANAPEPKIGDAERALLTAEMSRIRSAAD
jgi:hypothetical protein